ncbi:hypothetical protein GUITHDRAFT_144126 [Guillardia theta CCMP2712]|uniref:PNPLA domain-containing protein n=1 Tax=Guillardia theta (strain CCMP2712) TaxID=905079 RepID=L1IQE7_GUITC|nr:hypothetical protein GUITHDRAFT_144126 [Guillardia theta CCMP2712]EKX38521.1 hypothetical protein GUITHDRAFT_144126 [Guillardia theta CCMP2712]|eukprot:XP_005825501.1 hypothetical protein GUITHDRAFT_144126 [Guillardia theta CCMP2712]
MGKSRAKSEPQPSDSRPLIVFPGGGIYFWWQAGVVQGLQKRINVDSFDFTGASAGSLSAVFAACGVDMMQAFHLAQKLAEEKNVWTRKEGLAGIWGDMIYQWLDELLPENAAEICTDRVDMVAVSVTSVRLSFLPLKRKSITRFKTKKDLIEACMASVHVPMFLDGKMSRSLDGDICVDGSITFVLRNKPWHFKPQDRKPSLMIHHQDDKELMARKWNFLETISLDQFEEMFEMGQKYAEEMIDKKTLESFIQEYS